LRLPDRWLFWRAWKGEVAAEFDALADEEDASERAANAHERRTGTKVEVDVQSAPDQKGWLPSQSA
jgi:hypothetical protein